MGTAMVDTIPMEDTVTGDTATVDLVVLEVLVALAAMVTVSTVMEDTATLMVTEDTDTVTVLGTAMDDKRNRRMDGCQPGVFLFYCIHQENENKRTNKKTLNYLNVFHFPFY